LTQTSEAGYCWRSISTISHINCKCASYESKHPCYRQESIAYCHYSALLTQNSGSGLLWVPPKMPCVVCQVTPGSPSSCTRKPGSFVNVVSARGQGCGIQMYTHKPAVKSLPMLAVKAVASSCTHRLAVLVIFADARGQGCGIKLHTHKLALLVLFADARGQGCGIKLHTQTGSASKICRCSR